MNEDKYLVECIVDIETDDDIDHFCDNSALAILLIKEVVFINSFWWKKEWPDEAKKSLAICVNCNDTFYYASADAETATYDDIKDLYQHWKKDPIYGSTVWCIKKRKQRCLEFHYNRIKEKNIWDIEKIYKELNI